MSHSEPTTAPTFQPRRPALTALLVFVLAAATLCWPMLDGRFLLGDDQYIAGYGFRLFGAEMFRSTGRIPEWNPYLFGGMPFIAAMHGDIFYPTAWLRWILPVDTAMNLGFAVHIVLAGATMYGFLRALRVTWTGALVGGLGYQLSGIVASLVKPGHDGKLFVSALAPLLLLALLRAIRHRRADGYAVVALTVGLCLVSPQYQMAYYLFVAAGLWTLYLVFLDPERPPAAGWPVPLALALGAVLLGVAIAAIQIVPFLAYIPFSPRAAGGPSGGWEYATGFSMPPVELFTTVLPQFNGVLDQYWGGNFFKSHTEYLGAVVVALAALGAGDRTRRPLVLVLGGIALLFLLVAFGGHTPFYRAWYALMPMMDKVRAPGMAFFLVALPVAGFAGFGVDRLLRRELTMGTLAVPLGILGGIGLLGAIGVLQSVATVFAGEAQAAKAAANASALQLGSLRLLLFAGLGAAVLWSVLAGRVKGAAAAGALGLVVAGDLWSVDRRFFVFHPPAAELFRDDEITTRLRAQPKPFRVLDVGVYQGSTLMAYGIQSVLGYHGFELRFYDELLGGKNVWRNAGSPNLHDLLSVRYVLVPEMQDVPGFHRVVGPTTTAAGSTGVLLERDSAPVYVRVVAGAAKLPEDQVVPTVTDPRFPLNSVALFSDTASVSPAAIRGEVPTPPQVRPTLAEWAPGRMRVTLDGSDSRTLYLVIGENWYPDWHAEVDGKAVPVHRADHALLSLVLPPGAKEVRLNFASGDYARGRLITFLALLVTAALLGVPLWQRRRAGHG